jgi:hypothetical protein
MIGTNDAANVAAGSNVGFEERINKMLYVFGDDPVLWVDAVTLRGDGAYSSTAMRRWNDVLEWIAAQHPNVAILRWSDIARPEWFADDGIHYRSDGRAWRAAVTARALVEHFPGSG